jgi:hypothetical protein
MDRTANQKSDQPAFLPNIGLLPEIRDERRAGGCRVPFAKSELRVPSKWGRSAQFCDKFLLRRAPTESGGVTSLSLFGRVAHKRRWLIFLPNSAARQR